MPWVVLQIILPLLVDHFYIDERNSDITIGVKNCDFNIQYDWSDLSKTKNNTLNVCYENTAFISIGREPIHLTAIDKTNKPEEIMGIQ